MWIIKVEKSKNVRRPIIDDHFFINIHLIQIRLKVESINLWYFCSYFDKPISLPLCIISNFIISHNMDLEELKSFQIILLTLVATQITSFYTVIFIIFLSLYLHDRLYISTILSIVASFLPYIELRNLWFLIPVILNLILCYALRKTENK